MNSSTNLFEFKNLEEIHFEKNAFRSFLNEIWKSKISSKLFDYSDLESTYTNDNNQKFISFQEDNYFKSRNYVGVIKYNGHTINLLPKIFYQNEKSYSTEDIQAIQTHILWWLSYCRKFKFPNSLIGLSYLKSDFFEILIYLFAKYTRDLFNASLYQSFEEISDETSFMKGRLNINSYIQNNLSNAKWNTLNCTYDSFEFDNKFNRVVKSVAKLLLINTNNYENKSLLRDIIFILEEVEDTNATFEDCFRININPLFSEMNTVLDYCKLFLKSSVIHYFNNNIKVFAFLLPMEYVFEDFIFGFIDNKFPQLKAKRQESSEYLASINGENIFKLKHDIFIKIDDEPIIIDTKYKIVYPDADYEDVKYGISQADMYQMVSYAIRRGSKKVIMFYPNTLNDYNDNEKPLEFEVVDKFSNNRILISVIKVPIIKSEWTNFNYNQKLESNFQSAELILKEKMQSSLF